MQIVHQLGESGGWPTTATLRFERRVRLRSGIPRCCRRVAVVHTLENRTESVISFKPKKQSFWCTSSVLGSLFVVVGKGFFVVFWSTVLLAAGLLMFAAGAQVLEILGLVLQVVWNMCYFCWLHMYFLGMELRRTLTVSGSRSLLL